MSVTTERSRRVLLVALVALTFASGCLQPDPAVGDCDALLRGDRGERERQVAQEFNSYPLETRYRLYICGRQAAHAPWALQVPFAEGGEDAARFLEHKLESTDYDATVLDILIAFWTMRQIGSFDASSDPALMQLLEQRVTNLDGAMRESGEKYLQEIRDGSAARTPQPVAE